MLKWVSTVLVLLLSTAALATPAACEQTAGPEREVQRVGTNAAATAASSPTSERPPPASPEDIELYREAAAHAWEFVVRNTDPRTGLVGALPKYPYATTWDIGSGLAALYAAYELDLIDRADYDERMRRMLGTLRQAGLVGDVAYNKFYSIRTGAMVDRREDSTDAGFGWSVTDLGRLLIWLRIIEENHPQHADAARAVARRIRFEPIVQDGYLYGGEIGDGGVVTYQEGKVGYEQYAASGFELWGHPARHALDLHANTRPILVGGHELLADTRGHNKLTSEPFVLMGLEVGWSPRVRRLAERMLAAQKERFKETGQITIVSEDAVNVPPHYFYYYCIHCNGEAFSVDAPGTYRRLDAPRWVSTKAAFAWHALLPGDYTRRALEAVQPAFRPGRGWSSGIFEKNGEPTGSENINTHAVILESALYLERGRPLLHAGSKQ